MKDKPPHVFEAFSKEYNFCRICWHGGDITGEGHPIHSDNTDLATQPAEEGDRQSSVLRVALEHIANHPHSQYGLKESDYDIGVADGHRCAARIAKRALTADKEK